MKWPCFLFNPKDWICSPSVRRMTGDEVKAYIYLLAHSWLDPELATLDNDDEKLALLAGVMPDKWRTLKPAIMACFDSDGNGRIYSERLMKEAIMLLTKQTAGREGWTPKRREAASDRMRLRNLRAKADREADALKNSKAKAKAETKARLGDRR